MIEVLDPGLLTTVEDLGRPGLGHLGVPAGGAADPWALRVANVVAGNSPGAAALEATAGGARLVAVREVTIAIAGADLGAIVGGRSVGTGQGTTLAAGEELSLPRPASDGFRAYVAVRGGVDVPLVLGSRSTCRPGGFGGLEGRALHSGDRLAVGATRGPELAAAAWPGTAMAPRNRDPDGTVVLRSIRGPGAALLGQDATWLVAAASDRMGLRLEPAAAAGRSTGKAGQAGASALPSHGVVRGTIQVPPDGRPIVLGVDHQPTGGYPVAAVVITADLAALGQLKPGDRVRLEPVDQAAARRALAEQHSAWREAVSTVRGDAGWDALWRSAGA